MSGLAEVLTTASAVFAVTLVSRLPPGVGTVTALHLAVRRGRGAAVRFLAALTLVDLAVLALLLRAPLPLERLVEAPGLRVAGGLVAVAGGAGLVTAALRGRAAGARPSAAVDRSKPFLTGLALGIVQPGRWSWWATFGVAVIALARTGGPWGGAVAVPAFLGALALLYAALLWAAVHGSSLLGDRGRRWAGLAAGVMVVLSGVALLVAT